MLIVMSNLTTLNISADHSTLAMGPGLRWGDVYAYAEQYDRAVGGGRLSPVGVPGLLLAGGVNFYGNQHGWSADNVLEYEVVLASGLIVTVNPSSHADLFWALKGGSSNFGIVTKFTMRTFPSTQVYAGVYSVAGSDVPAFLDVGPSSQFLEERRLTSLTYRCRPSPTIQLSTRIPCLTLSLWSSPLIQPQRLRASSFSTTAQPYPIRHVSHHSSPFQPSLARWASRQSVNLPSKQAPL